jgi:hypothetical protein
MPGENAVPVDGLELQTVQAIGESYPPLPENIGR